MLFIILLFLVLFSIGFTYVLHKRRQAKLLRYRYMKLSERLNNMTPPDPPPTDPPGSGND